MFVIAGCGARDEQPLPGQQMRIAGGLQGGVYRVYAGAFAEVLNAHVPHLRAAR